MVARQSLASAELCKLDQYRNPRHLPTQALDQLRGCRRGATGRQDVYFAPVRIAPEQK